MHHIQINDQLYVEAQRRATASGFESVDAYVADILRNDLDVDSENFEGLFTPERLAIIDRAVAEADAGQVLSREEFQQELARRRTEWPNQNPREPS